VTRHPLLVLGWLAGFAIAKAALAMLSALTVRQEVTRDPNLLNVDDLLDAVSHTTPE
jgi:hypothetical protein